MKKIIMYALILAFSLPVSYGARAAVESPEKILEESQELFHKNDHDGALAALKKYFSKVVTEPKRKVKTRLRFLAIAAMGRIYLQFKKDPAGAIEWFEKIKKTEGLTDAEEDILSGWIAAAQDWIKLGKFPDAKMGEAELFELGKKYYDAGLKKQKFTVDQAGAADFSIASTYLVPFTVQFDKSPKIGEALFMMGDMRRRLWTSNRFWSENYYLSEAIRRFPATPLAVKSFEALREDVEFAYTGSSGNHTPQSWIELLDVLRKMAKGEDLKLPESKPLQKP
ncbi:MAG: hypothetical protein KGP28_08465 [Bdellovibrionales bacterium]|nr:hypothetical protein [Bdellovibrionales bacterium]